MANYQNILRQAHQAIADVADNADSWRAFLRSAKRPDVEHDFTKDGLNLSVEGDYVSANGTTLGGDDGIAVAYGLALLGCLW